jgi:hypothetical protein
MILSAAMVDVKSLGWVLVAVIGLAGCGAIAAVGPADLLGARVLTVPGLATPYNQIDINAELVQLPDDSAAISQAQAEQVAAHWAQSFAGTTAFSAVVLGHRQNTAGTGGPLIGTPGPLHWFFFAIGTTRFAPNLGGGPQQQAPTTPAPQSTQPYYLVIGVDATTGRLDGIELT